MTRLDAKTLLGVAAETARSARTDRGDYVADGIRYCGECHNPIEAYVNVPYQDEPELLPIACECHRRQYEAEAAARNKAKADEHRQYAMPNAKYRAMTFDVADPPAAFAMRYVENWQMMKAENIGLLLWGNVGNGKTHTAACIANALIDNGETVYMNNMASISSMLRERGSHDDIISKARGAALFVADDFGAEATTDYALQLVYELIETRVESGMPMIVTTNIDIKTMNDAIENGTNAQLMRVYSRLLGLQPVKFDGIDRRRAETKSRRADITALLGIGKANNT